MVKQALAAFCILLFWLPVANAGPSSWTVSDSDTTIILFGTFHIAKPDMNWMTSDTKARIEKADRLYLEVAPEQMSDAIVTPIIQNYGLLPKNQTLTTILPSDTRVKLENYLASRNIPTNAFDTMRPVFAAMAINIQELDVRGYAPEFGGEKQFTDIASRHGIPIFGFETAEFQIRLLSLGSFEKEVLYLSLTLDDMQDMDEMIDGMTESWLTGDDKKLSKMLSDDMSRIPGVEDTLIHDRNENWVVELNQLMKEPGYFFVAVGAGHLAGDKGVPQLMKNAGHRVVKN